MHTIAAFYTFTELADYASWQEPLTDLCELNEVFGTILLASEGINGTIAGPAYGVEAVIDHIRSDARTADLPVKLATADTPPFHRLRVRLKSEIVSLGVGPVDSEHNTGHRVSPAEWNNLIADPNVVLVDARNHYENAVGTFDGAINPRTRSFTQFPEWVASTHELADKPKVAMFCTGGIRCEKASAYLKGLGFDEVYQLDGGILAYLETVPEDESAWTGECYVFDRRVSVGHGLVPGDNEICVNCDRVLGPADRLEPGYVKGVTCIACVDTISDDRRARFTERQHQMELAADRGVNHLGRSIDTI